MNVLHVVASLDPEKGGVRQAVKTIVDGLQGTGVANEIATVDDPGARVSQGFACPVHQLGPAKTGWQYSKALKPWLLGNVGRFNAVILHGLWLYQDLAVSQAIASYRRQHGQPIPLYIMPHGMLDPWFQQAATRKIKALRNKVYWQILEARIISRCNSLLYTCQNELAMAQHTFKPFKPKKQQVVGLGVEQPPPFDAAMLQAWHAKMPTVAGKPYYLFLSRIHEKKGIDLLVKAYQKIAAQNPHAPMLVIAGPGQQTAYGQHITQLVNNSGVAEKIVFAGMLQGPEKWGAFYQAELFVLPSHQENFGIAIVEALACGVPVIVTKQVNIYTELQAGGAAIVANNTEAGVLQALQHWNGLPGHTQQQMRQLAPKVFHQVFSIPAATAGFINAIQLKTGQVHAT